MEGYEVETKSVQTFLYDTSIKVQKSNLCEFYYYYIEKETIIKTSHLLFVCLECSRDER